MKWRHLSAWTRLSPVTIVPSLQRHPIRGSLTVFVLGYALGLGVLFLSGAYGPRPSAIGPLSRPPLVARNQQPSRPYARNNRSIAAKRRQQRRTTRKPPRASDTVVSSQPPPAPVASGRLDPAQWQSFESQRSRLQAQLTQQGQTWITGWVMEPTTQPPVATTDLVTQIQALVTLELQYQAEVLAAQRWRQAIHFAGQASVLGNLRQPTLQTWYQAKAYWQTALTYLRQIPVLSSRRSQVTPKYAEYRHNLDVARYRSEILQSDFLRPIVAKAQLSPQTRITVCRVGGECRHYGGNAIVVSPASLIKIPVAIAVLQQLEQKNVSLGTPITVTAGNFTEDPAAIHVGKTYPLQVLLAQMLSHSSNIATNQLIDYFGWETLNQSLQQAGYRFSRVNFKLMGQARLPSNPGRQANTLNTDELSRMMQQIYLGQSPAYRVVQQALAHQQDRDLGIRALSHRPGDWLGEKTGRTSTTLGTTLALKSHGKIYIVTIVDQTGKTDQNLRQGIQAIAHSLEQSPF